MKRYLLLIFLLTGLSFFIINAQTADYLINDFDDNIPHREFFYTGPDGNKPNVDSQVFTSDLNYIKESSASRFLEWNNLGFDQYFGWGVSFQKFNASQAAYLSFWVIGTNGNERFEIKIKDVSGTEPVISSSQMLTVTKKWQKIKIPLSMFKGVNLSALENVNLGFNYVTSGKSGRIYVDDFRFEYQ